ncbi:hypothetical protein [Saccharibacillus endophyticus]|uniref:Aminoglycoside phosphotransferase n=1 Tax=Saccharibacillus endophyticus TaxID=2060666 RepID=A0ABQ1ZYB7_9BACL|nr:hypothetical protein [Saccharibacillus endophyticus]GGH79783.1 hypothetical protein GCM10007362_27100 [Saccharibacillus endophyticus]
MGGRDLVKEDMDNDETVRKLGKQLAELHALFREYEPVGMDARTHAEAVRRALRAVFERGEVA